MPTMPLRPGSTPIASPIITPRIRMPMRVGSNRSVSACQAMHIMSPGAQATDATTGCIRNVSPRRAALLLELYLAHVLVGEPVTTSPEHALPSRRGCRRQNFLLSSDHIARDRTPLGPIRLLHPKGHRASSRTPGCGAAMVTHLARRMRCGISRDGRGRRRAGGVQVAWICPEEA